jgi:putative resolvase
MPFVKSAVARVYYHITTKTLQDWRLKNKIKSIAKPSGQFLYWIGGSPSDYQVEERVDYIYCRVSSKKQAPELENQVEFLKTLYPTYGIIRDIGSGINHKRTGFQTLLGLVFQRKVGRIVVAHKDRFSRMGFDLFESIFKRFGTVLECVDSDEFISREEELAKDLLELITVFSARYYGQRSYRHEGKNLPKPNSKGIHQKMLGDDPAIV